MRKIKKKFNRAARLLPPILIEKFISLLIRNGKKSKSKKLLANCCIYTDKLLKKKFVTSKHQRGFFSSSEAGPSIYTQKSKMEDIHPAQSASENRLPGRQHGGSFAEGAELIFGQPVYSGRETLSTHYRLQNFHGKKKKEALVFCEKFANYLNNSSQFQRQNGAPFGPLSVQHFRSQNRGAVGHPRDGQQSRGVSQIFKKVPLSPSGFFQKSISRVRPLLSLQKLRKGGRTRYIPRALSEKKGMDVAMKWVINSSRKQHNREKTTMGKGSKVSQLLAKELWDCFLEQGYSWQKKEELHKLGAANKAFIRYNWW